MTNDKLLSEAAKGYNAKRKLFSDWYLAQGYDWDDDKRLDMEEAFIAAIDVRQRSGLIDKAAQHLLNRERELVGLEPVSFKLLDEGTKQSMRRTVTYVKEYLDESEERCP